MVNIWDPDLAKSPDPTGGIQLTSTDPWVNFLKDLRDCPAKTNRG